MSSEPAISVNNLSKFYQLYAQPSDRLKQFLWRGKRQYFREFWSLRDVSFDIAKGEVLGIIGRNGAGKSTLLQMLCGTLTPSAGQVKVQGRITALLELGSGFNPEFTGRENV
jgi:lipopolysaccharide transport system ATP-binding protein